MKPSYEELQHEMANAWNVEWGTLKRIKQDFNDDSRFYSFLEGAYYMAKASETEVLEYKQK